MSMTPDPTPPLSAGELERATARPWLRDGNYVYTTGEHGANICAAGEPRASCYVGYTEVRIGSPDIREAYANAALIVAAVNAYEPLLAFARHVGDCETCCTQGICLDGLGLYRATLPARQALAATAALESTEGENHG